MRLYPDFSPMAQAPIAAAAAMSILLGVSGCGTAAEANSSYTVEELQAYDTLPTGPCADLNDSLRNNRQPLQAEAIICRQFGHVALDILVVDYAGEQPEHLELFAEDLGDILEDYSQGVIVPTVSIQKPSTKAIAAFAESLQATGDSGCTKWDNAMRYAAAAAREHEDFPIDSIVVALNPTPACNTSGKSRRIAGVSNIGNGGITDIFTLYDGGEPYNIFDVLEQDALTAGHEVFHLLGDLGHANTLTQPGDKGMVMDIENGGVIDLKFFPTGTPVFYEYGDTSNLMGDISPRNVGILPLSAYQLYRLEMPERFLGKPTVAQIVPVTAEGVTLMAENAHTRAAVYDFGKYNMMEAQDPNGKKVTLSYDQLVFSAVKDDKQEEVLAVELSLGDSATAGTTHLATIANITRGQAGNTEITIDETRFILQFSEDGQAMVWDVTQS